MIQSQYNSLVAAGDETWTEITEPSYPLRAVQEASNIIAEVQSLEIVRFRQLKNSASLMNKNRKQVCVIDFQNGELFISVIAPFEK